MELVNSNIEERVTMEKMLTIVYCASYSFRFSYFGNIIQSCAILSTDSFEKYKILHEKLWPTRCSSRNISL